MKVQGYFLCNKFLYVSWMRIIPLARADQLHRKQAYWSQELEMFQKPEGCSYFYY